VLGLVSRGLQLWGSQCHPSTHNTKNNSILDREKADETAIPEKYCMKTYSWIYIVPNVPYAANSIGVRIDWQLQTTWDTLQKYEIFNYDYENEYYKKE
jgi:hypothetical protein